MKDTNEPYGINTYWIIFDDDSGELLTTKVYDDYDDAVNDALDDSRIIAIKL